MVVTTNVMRRVTRALLTVSATTAFGSVDSANNRTVVLPWDAYQSPNSERRTGANATRTTTGGTRIAIEESRILR